MFGVSAYIILYATRNFAHEIGIFWLGFRGPDCNVIAEQGGGPPLGLRGPDAGRRLPVAGLVFLSSHLHAGCFGVMIGLLVVISGVSQFGFVAINLVSVGQNHCCAIVSVNRTTNTTAKYHVRRQSGYLRASLTAEVRDTECCRLILIGIRPYRYKYSMGKSCCNWPRKSIWPI